jgi:NAD(P)-dependent dehydrogenase (short-subunit alcohol dehydrogenase family)
MTVDQDRALGEPELLPLELSMPSPFAALTGRTVLVTGGGSGLGAATAEVLAATGMCVAVADLLPETAETCADRITSAGGRALGIGLDVRSDADAQRVVEDVAGRFGALDVLINCAGTDVSLPFGDISAEAFDRVIDVNLRGPAVMVRAALPHLKRSDRGHVINIGSTASLRAWSNASAYHASKFGVRGLSEGLFTELRDFGIRVTTVIAGGMQTPFILDRFPETPLDLLQDPRNVALAIRFVLDMPPETVVSEITVLPVRETSWP